MNNAPRSFRLWKPDDSILEIGAKAGAALTVVALGTAFVYDAVLYQLLDARLTGLFVLADHIETAIYCVPSVVVGAIAFVLLFPVSMWAISKGAMRLEDRLSKNAWERVRKSVVGAGVIVAVIFLVSLMRSIKHDIVGNVPSWQRDVLDGWPILMFALLGMHLSSISRNAAELRKRMMTEFTIFMPIYWFTVTIVFAVVNSATFTHELSMPPLAAPDKVTLSDQGQLFGRLVRVIDRGVILGVTGPEKFVFIPKDKVVRIDFAAR